MRACLLAALTVILAGCASRDLRPIERVDPDTAVHLTIMAEPWMYVFDDPRQSANASWFLDVTLIETNRMGTRSYWLNAVEWSTVTGAEDAGQRADDERVKLVLIQPKSELQLACTAGSRSAAGITEPAIAVRGARGIEAWCPLSPGQVGEFGVGAPTAVTLEDEHGFMRSFVPWQVESAAVREFLKATAAGMN